MKWILIALIGLYLVGYAVLRTINAEVWDKDGQTYVLFPENAVVLYYLYRPMTYADGAVTGMRFHIGPHR